MKNQNMQNMTIVEELSYEQLKKLDAYVQEHYALLLAKFMEQFESYCRKITQMQEAGKKGAIAFVYFSMLRTNILAKRHKLRLDAYDENWYKDRAECSGEYDVGEIFVFFDEYTDILDKACRGVYAGNKLAEQQSIIFDESKKYLIFAAEIMRVGLSEASKTEWFNSVIRHEVFTVCIGEYQDRADILYKDDISIKEPVSVKRRLESKKQQVHTHEVCKNLDLSFGNYSGKCFQFSEFDGSDLTSSNFSSVKIICSSFSGAVIRNATFCKAQLFDVDFGGAALENVSFSESQLNHVSFAGAKLINVEFENLLYVNSLDFQNVSLQGTIIPEHIASARR